MTTPDDIKDRAWLELMLRQLGAWGLGEQAAWELLQIAIREMGDDSP